MNTDYKPMPELLAEIDAALAPYGITRIKGVCDFEVLWGNDGGACQNKSVTYCGQCEREICAQHAKVCCLETLCVGCAMTHVCPILAVQRMDS